MKPNELTIELYYEDALAAAWMAKHFGMKFTDVDGAYHITDFLDLDWEDHCNEASCHFYIHPDSLSILEPKYKDLLVGPNNMAAMFYMDASDKEPSKRCRIIARNGIPFMWPQRSEYSDGKVKE